jgi:cyanophycin synthetase
MTPPAPVAGGDPLDTGVRRGFNKDSTELDDVVDGAVHAHPSHLRGINHRCRSAIDRPGGRWVIAGASPDTRGRTPAQRIPFMRIQRVKTLRGPSLWAGEPVFQVRADLGDLEGRTAGEIDGLRDRLLDRLPAPRPHEPAAADVARRLERLRAGAVSAVLLPQLLAQVVLGLIGAAAALGETAPLDVPGGYRILLGFEEEAIDRRGVRAAWRMLRAVLERRPLDPSAEVAALRAAADRVRLGPSTLAIVRACEARGIPIRRLTRGSLVQLGWGARQRRIWTAQTDRTGAIAAEIASDKELTRRLLAAAGVPVPRGRIVASPGDAWKAARALGRPVVVKPRDANHAQGVAVGLTTRAQVEAAFAVADAVRGDQPTDVLVEQFVHGDDYRLLVVGGRMVAAYRGDPPRVVGDGTRTIAALVEALNADPRRGADWRCTLDLVEIDALATLVLGDQGYTPDSVPPPGASVTIQRHADLCVDVTDAVHPCVAACAVEAAEVVGLDIAGIDLRARRIDRPLEEQDGAIVEVNAGPALMGHLHPAAGTPRAVGEAIAARLFAEGDDGRIPLVAVLGDRLGAATARAVADRLRAAGRTVGLACSDGVFLGPRRLAAAGTPGVEAVGTLLQHPRLEAAVVQVDPGAVRDEGLPFDRVALAVLADLGDATRPLAGAVARLLLRRLGAGGTAIVSAEDPRLADLAAGLDPRPTVAVVPRAALAEYAAVAAFPAPGYNGVPKPRVAATAGLSLVAPGGGAADRLPQDHEGAVTRY